MSYTSEFYRTHPFLPKPLSDFDNEPRVLPPYKTPSNFSPRRPLKLCPFCTTLTLNPSRKPGDTADMTRPLRIPVRSSVPDPRTLGYKFKESGPRPFRRGFSEVEGLGRPEGRSYGRRGGPNPPVPPGTLEEGPSRKSGPLSVGTVQKCASGPYLLDVVRPHSHLTSVEYKNSVALLGNPRRKW